MKKINPIPFLSLLFFCLQQVDAQTPDLGWAKCTGITSGGSDIGQSIATDASGNVYTTGVFLDTVDFDPGPGVFNLVSNGSADIFIHKLDASGNLLWAKSMGNEYYGSGNAIDVDATGNVYVTGEFAGTVDFDPGPGIYNLTSNGNADIFIQKLDASGNYLWAKNMGGSSYDSGKGIAIDASGNVHTIGVFNETADFDPEMAVYNLTSNGDVDVFIQKMDASGNFIWAISVGGTGYDGGNAIAADASGNVYATGSFNGTVDFNPGPGVYDLTSVGADIFILKLSASGNTWYAARMGGSGNDYGRAIAVDASGNVFSTGIFIGTADFGPYNLTSNGSSYDICIVKLSNFGVTLWAKSMGDTADDGSTAIAVDTSGNVYSTGVFFGTADFDPGAGVYNLTTDGDGRDMYVQKLNTNGDFLWANSVGGAGNAFPNSLAVDAGGNVYSTGGLSGSADFNPGAGVHDLTSVGADDIFIQKLDAAGNFLWAESMGSADRFLRVTSLARDATGNIYIAGSFKGTTDFDSGPDEFYLTSNGEGDIYIQKLDASGNLLWIKQTGGAMDDRGMAVAVDAGGNVYSAGSYNGTVDFDPGPDVYPLTASGDADLFIRKLDASGNLLWTKSLDDGVNPYRIFLDVTPSGDVLAMGEFEAAVDFDPGPGVYEITSNGYSDAFVLKLSASGNLLWAKSMGGLYYEVSSDLAVDDLGNVYSTGNFESTVDFDPGPGVYNLTSAASDIFIQKLDAAGDFVWAKSMSGDNFGYSENLQIDAFGNIYSTGIFGGTLDFDPGPGVGNLTSNGYWDIFIQKLDASGNLAWVKSMGGEDLEWSYSLSVDAFGNVYTTGEFQGTIDFDPGPDAYQLTSNGGSDAFIQKLDASGNLLWVESIGDIGFDSGSAIDVDAAGNILLAGYSGYYSGLADFDPGPDVYNLSCSQNNIFIVQWSQTGSGVSQNGFESAIKVCPNPTTGNVVVDMGGDYPDLQIEIVSVTGQAISSRYYAMGHLLEAEIEGPPGLYFVAIKDGSGRQAVLKVVKE